MTAPGCDDRQLPAALYLSDHHRRVAGLDEPGPLGPVRAHRHVAAGEGDVARPTDDDAVDLDLRPAVDQLGEDAGDVATAMDRGAIRCDQASLPGEACGRTPDVSPAERCGERRQGILDLLGEPLQAVDRG